MDLLWSRFSAMTEIMDCYSTHTRIETYSAIQSVRYHMSARETTAVQLFSKKNPLVEPVDPQLRKNMQSACVINIKMSDTRKNIQRKKELLGSKTSAPGNTNTTKAKVDGTSASKSRPSTSVLSSTSGSAISSTSASYASMDETSTAVHSCSGIEEPQERKTFFSNLAKKLRDAAARGSFYDVKCVATKAEKVFHRYNVRCQTLNGRHYLTHEQSLHLYPDDALHLIPVDVHGDGNCLPRCGSLFICGSQNLHQEMRTRIVVELAVHEDFYLDPKNLQVGLNTPSEKSAAEACATYSEKSSKTPEAVRPTYRQEVLDICQLNTYMGMWQVHALASILKQPIMSIYPKLGQGGSSFVREDLHRMVHPRVPEMLDSHQTQTPTIIWTRVGLSLQAGIWRPNHFVVCLPKTAACTATQSTSSQSQAEPQSESRNNAAANKRKSQAGLIFFT